MDKMLLFAAELDQNVCTIDLHTENNIETALEKMEKEIFYFYKKGSKYCRIIFGIGSGILKENVLDSLKKNPLIEHVEEDKNGGSCIVFFS